MRKNAVITVTLFSRSRWSGYSVFDNGNEASEVTERRLLSISVTEVSFSIWIINNQLLPSKPLRLHNIIKAWNLLGLIKLCIELRHNSNRELCTESVLSSEIENVITRANISSMFIQGFWDRWWSLGPVVYIRRFSISFPIACFHYFHESNKRKSSVILFSFIAVKLWVFFRFRWMSVFAVYGNERLRLLKLNSRCFTRDLYYYQRRPLRPKLSKAIKGNFVCLYMKGWFVDHNLGFLSS